MERRDERCGGGKVEEDGRKYVEGGSKRHVRREALEGEEKCVKDRETLNVG